VASPACNPWVALDVTTDPVAHAGVLQRAHERGLARGGTAPRDVRALVLESWKRSLAAGVAPDAPGAPVRLIGDELELARERSPLAPVVGVIHSTLSSLNEDARHIVAIGDAHANLLWVSGDPGACEQARGMRFEEGAAWSEREAGTNAVGTAAALDHAVQIFSAEHLVAAVHSWTCSAAPVHEPSTGELIGVIDLTADLRTNHPHTLSLAALAAQAAEAALHLRALKVAARLREGWEAALGGRRTPSALLGAHGQVIASRGVGELPARLDLQGITNGTVGLPDGRVGELQPLEGGAILWLRRRSRPTAPRLRLQLLGHGASARLTGHRERGLRSLELLAVLAMHPEGMTAEQLALALYGERGKAVTIRAQIHRVRTYLGRCAVETHPYRLTAPIDADWLEVRRLVAAGRPREALRAYRGPLLPASDAPEIVASRGLLEESLRRSILTTADPELLSRWIAHPAGADDLAAARALVAVLPCGDPRRAAATASAAAIARRMSPALR
jgi:GAF domain